MRPVPLPHYISNQLGIISVSTVYRVSKSSIYVFSNHASKKKKKEKYRIPRAPSAPPLSLKFYEDVGLSVQAPYKRLPNLPQPQPISVPSPIEPNDNNFLRPAAAPMKADKPNLQDNLKRPMTRLIDKQKKTVEVIPKKDENNSDDTNLSDRLTKLLPKKMIKLTRC